MWSVVALIKSNWKIIAVVALVGAVALYYNHLTSTIAKQTLTIAQLEDVNRILEQNVETLESAVKANNESIKLLAEGAETTKQQFDALDKTVQQSSARLSRQLSGILSEPKPQTCDASIQYLIDAAKGFRK